MGELRDIELLCHWEVRPLNPDGDGVFLSARLLCRK